MMPKVNKKYCIYTVLMLLLHYSCKKETVIGDEPTLPTNPYANLVYPVDQVPAINIDSGSFAGLHKYIFKTKCAMPACHDGAFEPDFRTIQSAYNSMVLHPVFKNDSLGSFVYRVKPHDVIKSWLFERITTGNTVLGKMPLYAPALTTKEVQNIANWINGGAKDVLGNEAGLPNAQPQSFGMVATWVAPGGVVIRADSNRNGSPFNPFVVPNNTNITLWFGLYDDIQTPWQFTNNQIKFSTNPTSFAALPTSTLSVNSFSTFFSNYFASNAPYFTHITLNTNTLPNNQIIYCRIYIKDNDHSNPAEIPNDGNAFYQQSYYSFIVTP
jgi:hypothetical protein